MKQTSLVLFDIDGTLMKGVGRHHKDALLEAVKLVTGHSATFDGIETAGRLDRDLIAELLSQCGVTPHGAFGVFNEIIHECQRHFAATCAHDLSPFLCRNVVETLTALQAQGAALALVTGNLSKIGWRKMELAGLDKFFAFGAFAEDGDTRAAVAQIALQRARAKGIITENARISLIGDHTNDIAAAKANGFLSVAVATGVLHKNELLLAKPDILIEHLGELDVTRLL